MRKFKLHTGVSNPYEINVENFEKLTLKQEPYHKVGKDGVPRDFGVCPACDNPIQLIGLYKKLENTDRPYGKVFLLLHTMRQHITFALIVLTRVK